MKKILSLLSVIFLTFGCYDDSDIRSELRDHEERLAKLETLCKQMNTNISALQAVVTALQDKDYVTNVSPINEDDKVVGYTITFSKNGAVTIHNGKDGYVPAIGVKQDESDGQWYWTVDGEWLLDSKGGKMRASAVDGEDGQPGTPGQSGVTPTLKIVDGYWYVSYDGGKTWEEETLGQAAGESANLIEIAQDAENVFFKLKDGTVLTVAKDNTKDFYVLVSEIFELSASFEGKVGDKGWSKAGVILSTESGCPMDKSVLIPITEPDEKGKFVVRTEDLASGTKYYYSGYATDGDIYVFGEEKSFVTKPVKITHAIEILDVGTRSAKVVVNWEMSCLDPSIVLGLKYGAYGSTLDEYHPMESPQQSGSYEFVLEGLSPGGNYECSFYYIVNGVEKEGERHALNLVAVPAGQEGFRVRIDKSVIKADGIDCVTLSVLYDGVDVSQEASFYMGPGTLDDVLMTSRSFSSTIVGEYKFWASYAGEVSPTMSVKVTDLDIPSSVTDPQPNNADFVHRVFLNQHTGANCGYCPYMTRFLRESLVDDVKDMVVLSVLRNYLSPEPGFANVKNPTSGWPYMTFDNIRSYNYGTAPETFRNDIRTTAGEKASVGISANPVYNAATKQIIVTVAVKAAVAGEYNVGLWLMQDDYYDKQVGAPDSSYDTHHNNVRVAESSYMGAHCGYPLGYLSVGQTAEWIYMIDVKDSWWTDLYDDVDLDDLHFAAFVTTPYSRSFKNVNVIDFKYNEARAFEYLVETK